MRQGDGAAARRAEEPLLHLFEAEVPVPDVRATALAVAREGLKRGIDLQTLLSPSRRKAGLAGVELDAPPTAGCKAHPEAHGFQRAGQDFLKPRRGRQRGPDLGLSGRVVRHVATALHMKVLEPFSAQHPPPQDTTKSLVELTGRRPPLRPTD